MTSKVSSHECPVDTTTQPKKPVIRHEQVKSKGRPQVRRKVLVDLDTSSDLSENTIDTSSEQISAFDCSPDA